MTTKSELLKVVRTKCLECSVHQPSEVRNCHLQDCSLWRFRFGKDPNPAKRGFAENPAASRSVFSSKLQLEPDGRPEKEDPSEAGTSDGSMNEIPTDNRRNQQ